ncbi:MAG: hypothetical protein M3144_03785 [Actinomycetota bacterium]|nr:hypothetical protein [Actinomycetota bacterium]
MGSFAMFDRMIFRGHLLRLYHPGGVQAFLWNQGVPLTRFGEWAKSTTEALCVHARRSAEEAGRPYIYLDRATTRDTGQTKEDLARGIAERDGVTEGLVCILRIVEPCRSFKLRRNHATHKLDFVSTERKCVQHYWYLIDPELGFIHIRLQSWLPFGIQVYVNGREWLARQLDARGIGYVRADNALLRIDDLETAGELCERFAHRAWPRLLDALARRVNIHLPAIAAAEFRSYYWCLDQAEIATDVMFRDRRSLAAVLPDIVRHASLNMSSADVLRFLGRKLHPSLRAVVATDTKGRQDGWRVKHRLARNSVKVYDKVSVLRVETTINNPREFRVLRVFTDERGRRERRWCEMGKGVANVWRYYQVGLASNHRYLDALAAAPLKGEGVAALDALCRSKTRNGRHYARFSPLSPADRALFRAVLAGGHAITGFRNADLMARLYPRPPANAQEAHRRCARVSRLIGKLRGHGLVAKVPRARLYRPTRHGYRVMTAALVLHDDRFPDAYVSAA